MDDEADVIVAFDLDGRELARIGSHGSGPGQLRITGYVEVAADGTLWIADYGNGRLQHFAPDGTLLAVIGPFPAGSPGFMHEPNDVAVDAQGRLWVADLTGHAVVVFGPEGQPLARFGGGDDAYHPGEPTSLEFDSEGLLYVTERQHDVVWVYPSRSDRSC